jgi:L-amino acid N-acyltransferase YncA
MSNTLQETETNPYAISVAKREDIAELVALQEQNLVVNGGALSVAFPHAWFALSMEDMPIVVARRDGRLVGYLVCSSRSAIRHFPLPEAKFRAYPATPNAYNSGPLCVSQSERGRGLAQLLFRAARKCLPEREGVAFIRRDNSASRAVHAKNGFRKVAEFSHAGIDYVVVTNLE